MKSTPRSMPLPHMRGLGTVALMRLDPRKLELLVRELAAAINVSGVNYVLGIPEGGAIRVDAKKLSPHAGVRPPPEHSPLSGAPAPR